MPPDACKVAAMTTTVMIIMMTSMAGLPGANPKPKTKIAMATPLDMPRKMPP